MNLPAAIAVSSCLCMGFTASVIGAFKLELAKSLRVDNARIGALVSVATFTSMIMSLLLGVLIDMTGYRAVALTGFVVTSASFYLLASARSYGAAVFASFLVGVGGMCLNAFGSTLATVSLFGGGNPSLALNIGHMFGSIGAMTPSLALGLFLARLGYRRIGYALAAFILIPLPVALLVQLPVAAAEFELLGALSLLTNPVVIAVGAALYFYVGVEASFSTWITTYMTHLKVSKKAAQFTLSLFWLSLLLGRLGASKFINPVTEMPLITILAVITVINTAVMIVNRNGTVGFVTTIISGFTLGPMFPILVGRAFAVIDVSLRGSVYGILVAVALFGATTLPLVVGVVSRKGPFRKSLTVVLVATLALLAMIVVVTVMT